MSDFNANSTHFGIGTLPVSQRATVVRWTPSASERPDCVSPASVRSATRVSGCKPAMILTSAGAFAISASGVDARAGAGDFVSNDTAHRAIDQAVGAGGLEGVALDGGGFEGIPTHLAGEAGDECVCGFHAFNVACCYNRCNNLYQNSLEMTESYNADGSAPTLAQAMFVTMQRLTQFAINGTTVDVNKLDGSTTAYTLTLDDATNPTSSTRTS